MGSSVVVERQAWMTDEVYEWACLEEKARQNTFARLMKQGRKALVAIKAQHPLNSDGTPGPEYVFIAVMRRLRWRMLARTGWWNVV